jgi:hypothetical protein
MLGYYRKLNLALLNVIDRVRSVALQEHVLILLKFKDRLAYAHPGEKLLSVKRELSSHPNLLWHRAKSAVGGSTTLSVTEIGRGQRGDVSGMRLWLSDAAQYCSPSSNLMGKINEVFCMEQQ